MPVVGVSSWDIHGFPGFKASCFHVGLPYCLPTWIFQFGCQKWMMFGMPKKHHPLGSKQQPLWKMLVHLPYMYGKCGYCKYSSLIRRISEEFPWPKEPFNKTTKRSINAKEIYFILSPSLGTSNLAVSIRLKPERRPCHKGREWMRSVSGRVTEIHSLFYE